MDSGIVMMEKGASIKDLDIRKTIKYPLIFAVTNIVFLLGGYLFSKALSNIVDNKLFRSFIKSKFRYTASYLMPLSCAPHYHIKSLVTPERKRFHASFL